MAQMIQHRFVLIEYLQQKIVDDFCAGAGFTIAVRQPACQHFRAQLNQAVKMSHPLIEQSARRTTGHRRDIIVLMQQHATIWLNRADTGQRQSNPGFGHFPFGYQHQSQTPKLDRLWPLANSIGVVQWRFKSTEARKRTGIMLIKNRFIAVFKPQRYGQKNQLA